MGNITKNNQCFAACARTNERVSCEAGAICGQLIEKKLDSRPHKSSVGTLQTTWPTTKATSLPHWRCSSPVKGSQKPRSTSAVPITPTPRSTALSTLPARPAMDALPIKRALHFLRRAASTQRPPLFHRHPLSHRLTCMSVALAWKMHLRNVVRRLTTARTLPTLRPTVH